MEFSDIIEQTVQLLQQHQPWAIPIVMLLTFGESLVIFALFFPATVLLLAIGALIGLRDLAFWPIWLAATSGAILGDWLSYWLGCHYSQAILQRWPLKNRPKQVAKMVSFFQRYGISSLFIGRFFGPLRALMPFSAGICRMPASTFQWANVLSAGLWAWVLLAPGAFGLPRLLLHYPKLWCH
ncbi:MAG: DedA family protein [Candidatus Symbiodolus clandestinus]